MRTAKSSSPNFGAPGVSAQEVARYSGFSVEYTVRARDLPAYLATHTATRKFGSSGSRLPTGSSSALWNSCISDCTELWRQSCCTSFAGPVAGLTAIAAVLTGTVLFPALLPYIPTHDFSMKGFILGAIVAIPFAAAFVQAPGLSGIAQIIAILVPFLIIPAVVAYLALNFTGSTTFTSRNGVKKEIFRYVPAMVLMAGAGTILGIALGVLRLMGVA